MFQAESKEGGNANANANPPVGKVLMFDASKKETHHPGSGYKKLGRRLKGGCKLQL